MQTEAYKEGKASGLKWKASYNWVPGGPWIMTPGIDKDPAFLERCRQTKEDNAEYLRGWLAGLKAQNNPALASLVTRAESTIH